MPTYEYRCKECGERLEIVQAFSDDPLTECPACAGPLRKVFNPVGIAFKGSGFYRNDSRTGAATSSSSSSAEKSSEKSSDKSSSSSDKSSPEKSSPSSSSGDGSSSSSSSTAAAASA
jgi:putative FmdB family regulatory protein